jgi:hypothetical protein
VRRHRIAIPRRLITYLAEFYEVSHASALTTIRTARGDGLLEQGTSLQLISLQLISTAWRYRWVIRACDAGY